MIKDISRDELKQALDNSEVEYLFDARGEDAYEKSHILGAENRPADKVEQGIGLPDNKDARIVFYCTDPNWPASKKAARAAEEQGYTNVSRFEGGIKDWMKHELPVERDVHKV